MGRRGRAACVFVISECRCRSAALFVLPSCSSGLPGPSRGAACARGAHASATAPALRVRLARLRRRRLEPLLPLVLLALRRLRAPAHTAAYVNGPATSAPTRTPPAASAWARTRRPGGHLSFHARRGYLWRCSPPPPCPSSSYPIMCKARTHARTPASINDGCVVLGAYRRAGSRQSIRAQLANVRVSACGCCGSAHQTRARHA